MRRRDAIAGFGALAGSAALAQQPRLPVLGYLSHDSPEPFASRLAAFREGLLEAGYAEGRNVLIESRWADGQHDRLPTLAAELVERSVDVLVAPGGAPAALAARGATTQIPIVFEMGGDPVALRLVDSLNRPGGNATGVSSLNVEVGPKRLEALHELLPMVAEVAVMLNPTSPTAPTQVQSLQEAARALGQRLHFLEASAEGDFRAALSALPRLGAGGLVFTSDPFFALRARQLAVLASRHAVPAIHQSRDFPREGGLMSYGGDFVQSHRAAGVYAGRVLAGEKPAELPVQQVTKLEMFINLKVARVLGLSVPPSLVAVADEVIE